MPWSPQDPGMKFLPLTSLQNKPSNKETRETQAQNQRPKKLTNEEVFSTNASSYCGYNHQFHAQISKRELHLSSYANRPNGNLESMFQNSFNSNKRIQWKHPECLMSKVLSSQAFRGNKKARFSHPGIGSLLEIAYKYICSAENK